MTEIDANIQQVSKELEELRSDPPLGDLRPEAREQSDECESRPALL